MVLKDVKQYILVIVAGTAIFAHIAVEDGATPMSFHEKEELKEEARDMFYHAYRAYMENAYPADELMPLSCKGRWKDPLNSRGDLDDTLGNFSLTLIDSLDTLVILGDLEEFETGVKHIIKDVSLDQDVIVSVFETNIRVLGGLLSAHILSDYFQQRDGIMPWYRGELLSLAKDLGFRLLPAFNTTTGIPHSRVNLRHGLKNMRLSAHQETCTACAGTMILEMAALSRLTGEPTFEQKAHKAMDGLWRMRHRSSDLMGTVLNVQSGDWVRRDSGVGAGIDSYYEYCLKAYILLGDEKYLGRFNKHYSAIMKYISQGPMLVDVHMHRPHTNSKNFMDALLAFWPGLQVLKGDIKPAVETHEMLYQIMQRHNLIPEAFTTDFHVHWGQHPLRPEFVESTYFLYKATNDPYYLEVGKSALKSLQKHARVPCGYATIKDVRTGGHDDRMDSFVLAETFKYLYLLFADPKELLLDLDEFLFTTEAHLLPLSLSRNHNLTSLVLNEKFLDDMDGLNSEFARCCPNTLDLFPETVRKPLKNLVNGICPRNMKRKLLASQFTAGNSEHLQLLKQMGIAVMSMSDGRVQLIHTIGSAKSLADAKEGLLFMQEMLELSQTQKHIPDKGPLSVVFEKNGQLVSIAAGPAHFGKDLTSGMKVTAKVGMADPIRACGPLTNSDRLKGRIVVIQRGDCMFISKVRKVEEAGAVAAIVIDNTPGTSLMTSSMFGMSGDGKDDVTIPAVFLFYEDASELLKAVEENVGMEISIIDGNNTGGSLEVEPEAASRLTEEMDSAGHKSKTDFHAAIESLLGGTEIIKVAQQDATANDDNNNNENSKNGRIIHVESKEEAVLSDLISKFRQDLTVKLNGRSQSVSRNPIDEFINLNKMNKSGMQSSQSAQILDLLNQMDGILVRLLILVGDKPKGWFEKYTNSVSRLKTIMKTLEESLSVSEEDVTSGLEKREKVSSGRGEEEDDDNDELGKLMAMNAKIKYTKFKLNFKVWDDLAKMFLEGRKIMQQDDDVIIPVNITKNISATNFEVKDKS